MPADNFILRHWMNETGVLHKNLVWLHREMNATAIHDLRVAVKKLRSYLKLCSLLFETTDTEKLFAGTRELFSILGKHRNLEVCRELLLSFNRKPDAITTSLLVYLQLMQDQVNPHCRRALFRYQEASLREITNRLEKRLETISEKEIADKVLITTASSIKTIKHDLKDFENRSHRVRKQLKDISYWSKACPPDLVFEKAQLKMIDKILDHLGNAQNYEVLKANLKTYRKTVLANATAEYRGIKKMEMSLGKKKEGFLQKANRLTMDLLDEYKKSDPKMKDRLSAPEQS